MAQQPTDTSADVLALERAVAGRYVLERELGRGGMGVVLLARDLSLDRLVALKLLPTLLAAQPVLRERFLREARTAAGLSHPHIVPIHAVEEHEGIVFIAMAFVDGETLADRVRRTGPLSPREVRSAARASGLRDVRVAAARLLSTDRARLGALGAVAPAYELARRTPAIGRLVSWGAPLLDLEARRPPESGTA